MSLSDYIALANQPAVIARSHRAIFNTPALVTNGTFAPGAANTLDVGKVDTACIGTRYITLFHNRNLKIYANILRAQQQNPARRILAMMGQAHVGVLQELVAANPTYHVVPAATYLKTKAGYLLEAS